MAAEFHIVGALIMGILIGIVELIFVHQDEAGMRWMSHGLHAIPTCILFTFIGMNVPYVLELAGWTWLSGPLAQIGIPVIVGLVAAVKVKAAAAITQGHGSIGEKMSHALIIGALIAVSPFIWPIVAQYLPDSLKF